MDTHVMINREEESCRVFSRFCEGKYPHALHRYKYAADFFPAGAFAERTGGAGSTQMFRRYLKEYIEGFEDVELVKGKRYRLMLKPDGKFVVAGGVSEDAPCLSGSEQIIYHFLCFICIVAFWDGFERIRDMNYRPGPLIIEDFSDRVDEAIDVSEYIAGYGISEREIIVERRGE